jgi:hypothetical protein
LNHLQHALHPTAHQRDQDVVLAGEPVVQAARQHLRRSGDLANRGRREALLAKQPTRAQQHPLIEVFRGRRSARLGHMPKR